MYFGPAVEGLFTVGASLLPLILRLKKKKKEGKKEKKNKNLSKLPNWQSTKIKRNPRMHGFFSIHPNG